MKFKITLCFYLMASVLFINTVCFGQNSIPINNPVLEFKDSILTVSYNIDDKEYDYYVVFLEVKNSSNERIIPQELYGDVGLEIKPGDNKTIYWNLKKDNIYLDEEISVRVDVKPNIYKLSRSKLIFKSTIWPGWGQTKLKNGKPYWLIGVAGTSCIVSAYLYDKESTKSYNNYLDAIGIEDEDMYLEKAESQDKISQILGYTAAGIWITNILWVALMPNKIEYKSDNQKISFNVIPYRVGNSNVLALSLNLKL